MILANILSQIVSDYIRPNQDEPTYRKARLKRQSEC